MAKLNIVKGNQHKKRFIFFRCFRIFTVEERNKNNVIDILEYPNTVPKEPFYGIMGIRLQDIRGQ